MTVQFTTTTLETERLILRAPLPQDEAAFTTFFASQRSQFVGGPRKPREIWNAFASEIGHWVMNGYGMFSVTLKGSDETLGIVGHWCPVDWPETEIGWVLFSAEHEGQGIAREAAQACIDHAWDVLNWDTIVSYIDHGNDPSVALAKRLGAVLDPDAPQPKPDKPCYVYRHPRPEAA